MPIPFIVAGLGALAGALGVTGVCEGKKKMDKAKAIMAEAKSVYDNSTAQYTTSQNDTSDMLESVGTIEKDIFEDFNLFCSTMEKIQQRPEFKGYTNKLLTLPKFTPQKLQEVSITAEKVLGTLQGGGAGALAGLAASGATTSIVSALATASTGTAISGLSGAAATNATLAWLGGGAVSAGGGGMALGTAVLGGATLGVGLLVGALMFDSKADDALEKATVAKNEAYEVQDKVNKICTYLDDLYSCADTFYDSLDSIYCEFKERLSILNTIVNSQHRVQWSKFTAQERIMTQNVIWLVGLLYSMCNVKLVLKKGADADFNKQENTSYEDEAVNNSGINSIIDNANALQLLDEDNVTDTVLKQYGLEDHNHPKRGRLSKCVKLTLIAITLFSLLKILIRFIN